MKMGGRKHEGRDEGRKQKKERGKQIDSKKSEGQTEKEVEGRKQMKEKRERLGRRHERGREGKQKEGGQEEK